MAYTNNAQRGRGPRPVGLCQRQPRSVIDAQMHRIGTESISIQKSYIDQSLSAIDLVLLDQRNFENCLKMRQFYTDQSQNALRRLQSVRCSFCSICTQYPQHDEACQNDNNLQSIPSMHTHVHDTRTTRAHTHMPQISPYVIRENTYAPTLDSGIVLD